MLTKNVTNWELTTRYYEQSIFEGKMHRGLGLILTFRKDMLVRVHQSRMSLPNYRHCEGWGEEIVDVAANIVCSINICVKKCKHQLRRKTRNGRLICQWTVIRINKESRQKARAGRLFPFFFFLPSRRWSFDTVDAFFFYAV